MKIPSPAFGMVEGATTSLHIDDIEDTSGLEHSFSEDSAPAPVEAEHDCDVAAGRGQ